MAKLQNCTSIQIGAAHPVLSVFKVTPLTRGICGIYLIKNLDTRRCYVGASMDVRKRWKAHSDALRGHRHKCRRLNEDFQKDASRLVFELLERCSPLELQSHEQLWTHSTNALTEDLGYHHGRNQPYPRALAEVIHASR